MEKRPSGHIEPSVNSLAELHFPNETLDSVMGHIGALAIHSLEGWHAAGTTMVEGGDVATFGITDDRVHSIDQAQYDAGRGPCVDATKTGDVQYFDGASDEPRWRQFAEAAGSEGIYSVLSFPLKVNDQVLGALNLYSSERDALRPGQKEDGWVFASQAAVALANAKSFIELGSQVGQLEQGLQSRTMIGQATGLLMAQEGMTSAEAFEQLVHVSQNANIKLRDIAERYIQTWDNRTSPQGVQPGPKDPERG